MKTAVCHNCIHFDATSLEMVCAAFPAGIPSEIVIGNEDHVTAYPGDHGIQFELKPELKAYYSSFERSKSTA